MVILPKRIRDEVSKAPNEHYAAETGRLSLWAATVMANISVASRTI
jgi:hypothetical protein